MTGTSVMYPGWEKVNPNTQKIIGPGWATEMFHIPNEADREKLREMIYDYKDASTPGSCP